MGDYDTSGLEAENYELRLRLFSLEQQLAQHLEARAVTTVEADQTLLLRSRDALARMEADLGESRSEISELSARVMELDGQLGVALADVEASRKALADERAAVVSERAAMASERAGAEAAREALQSRLSGLTADCERERSAAVEGAATIALIKREVKEGRAKLAALAAVHGEQSAEMAGMQATVHNLTGEAERCRAAALAASSAAAAAVEAQKEGERVIAALEGECADTRAALDEAVADSLAMASRLREHASSVASLESSLDAVRTRAQTEREGSREVEKQLRATMGQFLALVVRKFSAAAHGGGLPGADALLAALSRLPSSDDLSSPGALERAMAALDSLPAVAGWFGMAAASLSQQVEARVTACLATVDVLSRRVDSGHTELSMAHSVLASAGASSTTGLAGLATELAAARMEVEALRHGREEAARHSAEVEHRLRLALDDVAHERARSAQAPSPSHSYTAMAHSEGHGHGSGSGSVDVRDHEHALRQLRHTYEDKADELSRAMRRGQAALEAALADRSAEVDSLKDKLATVLRRLETARSVTVPAAVKAALGDEVSKAGALVRDAATAGRTSKASSDRVLAFLKAGGLGLVASAIEPPWVGTLRASLMAHATSCAGLADAVHELAGRLHHFSNATVLAAVEEGVAASTGERDRDRDRAKSAHVAYALGGISSNPVGGTSPSSSSRDRGAGGGRAHPNPQPLSFFPPSSSSSSSVGGSGHGGRLLLSSGMVDYVAGVWGQDITPGPSGSPARQVAASAQVDASVSSAADTVALAAEVQALRKQVAAIHSHAARDEWEGEAASAAAGPAVASSPFPFPQLLMPAKAAVPLMAAARTEDTLPAQTHAHDDMEANMETWGKRQEAMMQLHARMTARMEELGLSRSQLGLHTG